MPWFHQTGHTSPISYHICLSHLAYLWHYMHFLDLPWVKVVLSEAGTKSCHCQVFVGGVPQDLNQDDLYVLWQTLRAQIVRDGDIHGEDLLLFTVCAFDVSWRTIIRNSVCKSGTLQWTSLTKKRGNATPRHRYHTLNHASPQWFWPLTTSNVLDGDVIRKTRRWSPVYSICFERINFAERTVCIYIYYT